MTISAYRTTHEIRSPNGEKPHGSSALCSPGATDGPNPLSQATHADEFQDLRHKRPRRPAWRQRLVLAERGLVRGVRSDSAFFVHFFGISIVIAAAVVLRIGWMQWVAIAGCLTLVLTAEMFNQALRSLAKSSTNPSSSDVQRALAIGTAAVVVACAGSIVILLLVFWQRLEQLFAS